MPYKPTGRPPGRPKTNWYETLSARVPQDLAEQVRKYAARHRQTLSDVFRDGFTLLLQDDRYTPMVSDRNGAPGTPEKMSDMNGTQGILSDTIPTATASEMMSGTNGAHPTPLDGADLDAWPVEPVAIAQQPAPPALDYDPSKYVLGKLCPRGHDYQGTGQTLLTIGKRRCLPCEATKKREKRQAAGVA